MEENKKERKNRTRQDNLTLLTHFNLTSSPVPPHLAVCTKYLDGPMFLHFKYRKTMK